MARLVGREQIVLGCEGPVNVHRGEIEYREREANKPEIKQKAYPWIWTSGSAFGDEKQRYFRYAWGEDEVICGRKPIEQRPNEVPFTTLNQPWTNVDGSRHAAFVSGNEIAIQGHLSKIFNQALLDSVSDYQAAQREGDDEGAQEALDEIADSGFSLEAVVGRGNIEDEDDDQGKA